MTAWLQLKANSTLAAGTAWDLLTHPRAGHIYNDAILVDIQDGVIVTQVNHDPIIAELEAPIDSAVISDSVVAEYQIPAVVVGI